MSIRLFHPSLREPYVPMGRRNHGSTGNARPSSEDCCEEVPCPVVGVAIFAIDRTYAADAGNQGPRRVPRALVQRSVYRRTHRHSAVHDSYPVQPKVPKSMTMTLDRYHRYGMWVQKGISLRSQWRGVTVQYGARFHHRQNIIYGNRLRIYHKLKLSKGL